MKHIITTADAPEAIGPYSQAIIVERRLITSGQLALIPGTNKQLDNSSIASEAHRVMDNLAAILKAAGCTFDDVIRARIYISKQDIFTSVNEVYAEYFTNDAKPVRECVVAQPPIIGANVEISLEALLPSLD